MKHRWILTLALLATACNGLEKLETRMDSLEARMTALENQVKALNKNVEGTAALMEAGTIRSAEEKDGVWTIVLSDDRVITLTSGSVGVGAIPVMTIDKDGYWMVDYGAEAVYVLSDGEKIKATGTDGITPVFGVDADGQWTVSYDGGKTFTQVLGVDGKPVSALPAGDAAADSYFKAVTLEGGVFTLVLKDGTVLELPVVSGFRCAISAPEGVQTFSKGETKTFAVTLEGVAETLLGAPHGWTVSLDGATLMVTAPLMTKSAVADSRSDVSILAISTSGYSAIAKIKVKIAEDGPAPEVISDFYEAYEAGKEIVIAGVSYNKAAYGEAILLKAEIARTSLKDAIHGKSGVFFLEQAEGADFDIPTVTEINGDVILVSRYADKPVTVRPTVCSKLRSGSLVMKNIIFDLIKIETGTNATYAFNNANATADFTRWHFEDCRIINVKKPILYASVANYGFKSVVVRNCVFQLIYTSGNVQLFNFYGSTVLHNYKELVFDNNVVFNANCNTAQIFQYNQNIAQNGSPWECTLSVRNNIFYNCPSSNGYFKFYQLSSLVMRGNIFWADLASIAASYCFILYSDSQSASVVNADDNIAYGLAEGKNWLYAHTNSKAIPEVNTLTKLGEDPFVSFNTSSGSYSLKADYAAYGPQK